MSERYNHRRSHFTCMDIAFKSVVESSADRNGSYAVLLCRGKMWITSLSSI